VHIGEYQTNAKGKKGVNLTIKKIKVKVPSNKPKKGGKKSYSAPMSKGLFAGGNRFGDYALALHKPFADNALGARVPDMYSAPTVTYHTKGTITCTSNATGVCSLVLSPNPLVSCVDMTGSTINAAAGNTGMAQFASSTTAYSAVSQVNLQNAFTSYRVVGVGIRMRNLIPPTTATGRIIIAPFCVSGGPGPQVLSSQSVTNIVISELMGAPLVGSSTTSGLSSTILELPDAEEYTMQQLITNNVDCWSKPISPGAFTFHNTYNTTTLNGSLSLIDSGVVGTTSGLAFPGSSDLHGAAFFEGWQGMLIRAEGLPNSINCLEIEYIYHLEGTPALPSTTAGQLVPTAGPVTNVNLAAFNAALSSVLGKPPIELVCEAITGSPGAGKMGAQLITTMMAKLGMTI